MDQRLPGWPMSALGTLNLNLTEFLARDEGLILFAFKQTEPHQSIHVAAHTTVVTERCFPSF